MGAVNIFGIQKFTSDIVIVSSTRMGGDSICVGAFDLSRRRNIRLLNATGQNQLSGFPLRIGNTASATYTDRTAGTRAPHTEDVLLISWNNTRSVPITQALQKFCYIVEGGIRNTFSGSLSELGGGALSIGASNVPDHSVCFWRADQPLVLDTRFDNKRYVYESRYGRAFIKYVGLEDPIPIIQAGTIIRLSLARWWRPPGGTEDRCFLQLSGWYS